MYEFLDSSYIFHFFLKVISFPIKIFIKAFYKFVNGYGYR